MRPEYESRKSEKKDIQKFFAKDYAYTIHKNQARRKPPNPTYKYYKRYQFQVCKY